MNWQWHNFCWWFLNQQRHSLWLLISESAATLKSLTQIHVGPGYSRWEQ
jgi:hypothetical protein